jgi:hypothetical protein
LTARLPNPKQLSKYKPEYCEQIVEFLAKGHSVGAFAGHVGVHRDTVYEWAKTFPKFDDAFSKLIAYAAYQWPGYRDAPHHRLIARKLEAVERGEITRLMITMPPRHGKSMLASEFFPAWYLGRNPDHYVSRRPMRRSWPTTSAARSRTRSRIRHSLRMFPGVAWPMTARAPSAFISRAARAA